MRDYKQEASHLHARGKRALSVHTYLKGYFLTRSNELLEPACVVLAEMGFKSIARLCELALGRNGDMPDFGFYKVDEKASLTDRALDSLLLTVKSFSEINLDHLQDIARKYKEEGNPTKALFVSWLIVTHSRDDDHLVFLSGTCADCALFSDVIFISNKIGGKLKNSPWVKNNCAMAYMNIGQTDRAIGTYIELFRHLGKIPTDMYSNYLLALQYADKYTKKFVSDEHKKYGQSLSRMAANTKLKLPLQPRHARLRVGFVSKDFREHSVSYFAQPLIENLSKGQFDIYVYDTFAIENPIAQRIKPFCTKWHNVRDMSDKDLVALVAADEIDILIDLSGHTGGNRLSALAYQAAPIQVTWLGHPNTTGLSTIQWRLTDIVADPEGEDQFYSERLYRLPNSFVCYRPLIKFPERVNSAEYSVQPTPALKNGYITFGTCNNLAKIGARVIKTWSKILQKVENSKLLIESPGLDDPSVIEYLRSEFGRYHIHADRLLLTLRDTSRQYLIYNAIDIALDPFPCSGGTTTCDLLWMGVPIVTLSGDRFVSRLTSSMLSHCGRSEWIAADENQYVDKVVALATDAQRLNTIRQNLRIEFSRSPIMDEALFAKNVADALEFMYNEYVNEKPSGDAILQGRSGIADTTIDTQRVQSYISSKNYEALCAYLAPFDMSKQSLDILFAFGIALYKTKSRFCFYYLFRALYESKNLKWCLLTAEFLFDLGHWWAAFILLEYIKQDPSFATGNATLSTLSSMVREKCRSELLNLSEAANIKVPNGASNDSIHSNEQKHLYERFNKALQDNRHSEAYNLADPLVSFYINDSVFMSNYGVVCKNLGLFQKAIFCFHYAMWLSPLSPNPVTNLGNVLNAAGKPEAAMSLLSAGVLISPNELNLYNTLAGCLGQVDQIPFGTYICERANRSSSYQPIMNNYANLLKQSGDVEASIPLYKGAIANNPENSIIYSNYLLALQYADGYSTDYIAAEHFNFDRYFSTIPQIQHIKRNRPNKIRLGFVSGDLRNHSVSYFALPLFENIDKDKFSIFVYDTKSVDDKISKGMKSFCAAWISIAGMTDDEAAQQIYSDKIDILVDVSGHTSRNRLAIFARKAAPIQVTWLGHPNTTGLKAIDWRISDPVADPDGSEQYYSEKLWRLTDVFCCYRPLIRAPELRYDQKYAVKDTPALRNGFITFGCCNNLAKITPRVLSVWANILKVVPSSKLLIEASAFSDIEIKNKFFARFASHGISRDRLVLLPRDTNQQYLIYNQIDIALDPFPCTGGTTTCDLLWMGVPLVTLTGSSFVHRLGATILKSSNFEGWIAMNVEEYISIAINLAADVDRLNQIRHQLRERFENSPMMQEKQFVRGMEAAFIKMIALSENYIGELSS